MDQPIFPLIVLDDERLVLRKALRIFRDDLGHEEHRVADVVEDVLERLPGDELTTLDLDAAGMKVTWSALHTLLDDSARGQAVERGHIRALLERMPGEHDIRAIDLDDELRHRERPPRTPPPVS